ncbi:hypothetical protein AGMMS49982_09130 [Bacteroidia bacterium]|nr:hypothetical protein AGMMS49982_09130 [Bacteroidia bacterium]
MKTSKELAQVFSSVDTAAEAGELRLSKIGEFLLSNKEKGTIVNMRAVLR